MYNFLHGDFMINLVQLLSGTKDEIIIDEYYEIYKEKYSGSDILDLSKIKVDGTISRNDNGDCFLNFLVSGKMKINDSVTLEEVWYPFSFELSENLDEIIEKDENILDIIELLWQNIVLEVPLRYTEVDDFSIYQGDGWKLVSEEELDKNNPFSALLNEKDRSD